MQMSCIVLAGSQRHREDAMEFTKFGHACIELAKDGRRLVVDPGAFTHDVDLTGVEAILITHEHPDHFVEERVRAAAAQNPALEVWANASVAGKLDGLGSRVHVVGAGDAFTAAGFEIQAHGQWHAVIHPDIPRITNVGFLFDDRLFHPGDALTVPDQPIDILMLPAHAPWSRISDLIDWVREISPTRCIAVHDGALNDTGLAMVGGLLGDRGPGINSSYRRLEPPAHLTLD
jgi:L-ascorbate metabolism protein UlaG (beta-lactamase superfamily)